MTAVFGYEFDSTNRLRMGKQARCVNYVPEFSHFPYDVSVIRLSASLGNDYGQINLADTTDATPEDLFIIQHPGSQPKQVSFINCRLTQTHISGRDEGTDFTHTCDTAGGSSGSPIFNAEGLLVGLHHFGFQEDQTQLWTQNRGVHGTNIAVWFAGLSGNP